MGSVIDTILAIVENAWDVFLLLAPLFMIGLLVAGLLYVLISKPSIRRMVGREGMGSVTTAAAFGVPLPICSCGVIPVTATLRRKGASRSAAMSFLITTPETGTDSILVTWGLMGPVMAIIRPIVSFVSALLAGMLAIALLRGPDKPAAPDDHHHDHDHDHDHHHHHGHDHDHSHDPEDDPAVVGPAGLARSVRAAMAHQWHRTILWSRLGDWNRPALKRWENRARPEEVPSEAGAVPLRSVAKRVFTFAFVEMADDILFALVVGVLLSGVVMVLVPDDLGRYGLGGGMGAYVLMLIAGVPLYMCASASTPIAAALVAKGLSPGAALVFLLTGPATNTATIFVLLREFGPRFVAIYLGSIVAGAIAGGLALDTALIAFGWQIAVSLDGTDSGLVGAFEWIGAALLLSLIFWRFWKGAAAAGMAEMTANLRSAALTLSGLAHDARLRHILSARSRVVRFGVPMLLLAYLATGLTSVPAGYLGYGKLFGAVRWAALDPGLHFAPPWPIGEIDVLPSTVTHRIIVGLEAEAAAPENVELDAEPEAPGTTAPEPASAGGTWHGRAPPIAAKSRLAEFLAGDENFIRLLVAVHYRIPDPYAFYYLADDAEDIIAHGVQATAREYIAGSRMDDLLSRDRTEIEHFILNDLREHVGLTTKDLHEGDHTVTEHETGEPDHDESETGGSLGIEVVAVNVIEIHPPPETAAAFREVSSAQEDRETAILEAERSFTLLVPRAFGNAAIEILRSQGLAAGRIMKAEAERTAFIAKAEAVAQARGVLSDLLWLETSERALNGREIFILPPGTDPQSLTLWRARSAKTSRHHEDEDPDHEEGKSKR